MLVLFQQLLADARAGGYAVGYFEAWDVYSLEAVAEAAEAENIPVILGIGGVMMEPGWFDGGGLERLAAVGLATARATTVPTAFLLNEVATLDQVARGIRAGFNAVMLDSSDLPYAENVRLTRQVVAAAHAVGVAVEAELGALPDASEAGVATGRATDPDEAACFVAETGVDALAVSVGNVHILTEGEATIDCDRLAAIHRAVPIPLVLHGGSGFPAGAIRDAIASGVAKVNFGTALKAAFLDGLADAVRTLPSRVNYHQVVGSRKEADVLQQAKLRLRDEIVRRMRQWRIET
jgi:fructose-bisphosphate aldolase class II